MNSYSIDWESMPSTVVTIVAEWVKEAQILVAPCQILNNDCKYELDQNIS